MPLRCRPGIRERPGERIASFDQDGTLWVEQPVYPQVRFILDRVPGVVTTQAELEWPTAAFGNSTGDWQMLEYTKAGDGPVHPGTP